MSDTSYGVMCETHNEWMFKPPRPDSGFRISPCNLSCSFAQKAELADEIKLLIGTLNVLCEKARGDSIVYSDLCFAGQVLATAEEAARKEL